MTVIPAIIKSNNPFFYTIGNAMKSSVFIDFARRFGFGEKTGLPLVSEGSGNMPDNIWMRRYHRRNMHRGDHYNNAIGQGVTLATPLQVAQSMAAIANGSYLPKLQLVRQMQDSKGKVIAANTPDVKTPLQVDPLHIATIKEGMMKVVNSAGGTGKAGKLSFATLCGKTGTGQWKDPDDNPKTRQDVAWFAGFFPLNEPKYAFAALYEGDPGEKISGGGNAAPIIKSFFTPLEAEIKSSLSPPARAVIVSADSGTSATGPQLVQDGDIPKAVAIDPETGEEIVPKAVAIDPETGEEIIPKAVPIAPEEEEEEIPRAMPVAPDAP